MLIALVLLATGLTFDVATVKPSPPLNPAAFAQGKLHAGMNVQGDRVDIGYMSIADLITVAYGIKPYQLSGPDWMKTERFDILAKMPEGATKEQVPEMLQTLLAERFQLKIHRDTHEDAIYALVVAKGGHKLKESPPDEAAPTEPAPGAIALPNGQQIQINRNGANPGAVVRTPEGGTTKVDMTADGHMRLEMSKMTMAGLAQALTRFVDRPVFDMTDLKGNFQVALELPLDAMLKIAQAQGMNVPTLGARGATGGTTEASDPSSSGIFTSIQQLGLRLEPRKMPLETIIVDHAEKTPTEN